MINYHNQESQQKRHVARNLFGDDSEEKKKQSEQFGMLIFKK